MLNALFLCDDPETVIRLSDVFRESGFSVTAVNSLPEARSAMLRDTPDVALMDYELLGSEGLRFLEESRLGDIIDLILMTADPKLAGAVRGMRAGASDYLKKPVDAKALQASLAKVVAAAGRKQSGQDDDANEDVRTMQGDSPSMRRLFTLLRKVSETGMTVLLVGESGVGKELAARAIHRLSDRSPGPLVAVNCGAISPEILESELFGHEKGSFTGANKQHVGFFERASSGTLFLDEITETSPELQVKLLRVLESGCVRRVGGEMETPIDVRVIAATNRSPDEAMDEGVLREDLYYRLAQFPLRVPPLRERGDDVITLARRFLAEFGQNNGVEKTFSREVLELLRVHDWPGNVRELKNVVGRAYVLAGDVIHPDDLPPGVVEGAPIDSNYLKVAVGMPLDEVERRAILATVEHLDGDKKAAATALGISLKTLYKKLKKYRGE